MNSDFKELLALFNDKRVKYLVVGGYAVIKHGRPRFTGDLDIWVEPSLENSKKVYQALQIFGAPVSTLTAEDFSKPGFFFQMGVPPCRIDILMSVSGGNFEEAYKKRVTSDLDIGAVNFIGIDELLATKRAAGRAKDLADVEALEKIAKAAHSRKHSKPKQ
jgi:hypothetical protein